MEVRNYGGRKNSMTNIILLALERAVDGSVRLADFGYHSYKYTYGIPELNKTKLSQALKRLREKGLVDFIDEEELVIRLTDSGREKAVIASLQQEDRKWDGRWRVVIFDIPEKRRAARDVLRYRLKQWGFTPWQKSVWVSRKNCTKPLRNYIKQIGIGDWVMVLESDNIG